MTWDTSGHPPTRGSGSSPDPAGSGDNEPVLTDGALALALDFDDADTASAAALLHPENRVNGFRAAAEDCAGENVLQFPYWRLENESGYDGSRRQILNYLRARYYDPATAQFLSVDPMVAKTMSPYGYAAGDPLNASDPSGLDLNYYYSYDLGKAGGGASPASVLWWLQNHPDYEFPFSVKNISGSYTSHGPGLISPLGSDASSICAGGNYSLGTWGLENPIHVDEAAMEGNVAVLRFTALAGHSEGEGSTIRFSSWVNSSGELMFDVTGHDTFNYDNSSLLGGLVNLTWGWGTHGADSAWMVQSTWDTLARHLRGQN
jgi:RHS repeat-associated protein